MGIFDELDKLEEADEDSSTETTSESVPEIENDSDVPDEQSAGAASKTSGWRDYFEGESAARRI